MWGTKGIKRYALMRVKGKSGYFPYFLPWQEWGSACCSRGLIPARPLCLHHREARAEQNPPCPASGLSQPSAHRWRGSQELDGICCCLGVTHTNSNLAATTWVGNTSMELSLQQHPALMHSWGSHRGMPGCSACTGEGATASWAWRRPCAHCPFPKAELQGDIPSSEHKGKGGA